MDPLQFTLFFVALVVGYILVHLRLVRFEAHLREIAGLRQLNERLQGVSDALQRISLATVEDRLDLACAELNELSQAAARIERALAERRSDPVVVAAPPRAGSAPERVREAVESKLAALGYSNVQILTDLSGVSLDDDAELTVECDKQHIVHKGKVMTGGGGVRDVRLQDITRSFP
jgi:hypothetical protein